VIDQYILKFFTIVFMFSIDNIQGLWILV